jgi:multidrug efflux system membrane fusion protein
MPTVSRKSKVIAGIAIVVVAGVFIVRGHGDKPAGGDKRRGAGGDHAVPVKVAEARQGDLDVKLDVIGRAEAFSTVSVRSRVNGQLRTLEFKPGDRVKSGQVIARIDASLLEAQVKQAEGVKARDEALLAKAQADLARFGDVAAKGYISKAEYDQYKAAAATSAATVKSDLASVELARTQLSYATIRAPFDGVAGAPLVFPGAQVNADQTDIVVINQVQPIHVRFAIAEAYLDAIKRGVAAGGVPVNARIPGADEASTVQGTLDFLDNAVDPQTGTIVAKARFDNIDARLTPNQFVNVAVPTQRLSGAITVPAAAMQTSPDGWFVFVVKNDGSVEQRPVTTGPAVEQRQVVAQGLKAGEKVVTEGQLLLVAGAKVKVVGDGVAEEGAPAKHPKVAENAE